MLQYLDWNNEWHTLDIFAVREIYPRDVGKIEIDMKEGNTITAQYLRNC